MAVEANQQVLLQLFDSIEEESTNAKTVADARGLHVQLVSFEFLLAIVVLKQLLEHTNVASEYLQSEQIDLAAAVSSIQATLAVLERYRTDSKSHEYFESAKALSHNLDADVPTLEHMRRRKVPRSLDQMWQTEHQRESLEDKYRVEFYFHVLDCMIEQIEQRFSQATQQRFHSVDFNQKRCLTRNRKMNINATWSIWVHITEWMHLLCRLNT